MKKKGFYMLAGTLLSEQSLVELQQMFSAHDFTAELQQDELKIPGDATILVREGFAHESILVGHAREHEDLLAAVDRVSALLQQHRLAHDYEIYDRENQLVDSFDYAP